LITKFLILGSIIISLLLSVSSCLFKSGEMKSYNLTAISFITSISVLFFDSSSIVLKINAKLESLKFNEAPFRKWAILCIFS
jgi:hypothetical protein